MVASVEVAVVTVAASEVVAVAVDSVTVVVVVAAVASVTVVAVEVAVALVTVVVVEAVAVAEEVPEAASVLEPRLPWRLIPDSQESTCLAAKMTFS